MQPTQMIKVLLVDRHAIARSGLSLLLGSYADFQVTGQAQNADEALRAVEAEAPDIVLTDIGLPGSFTGLDLVRQLRQSHPRVRVLVMADITDPTAIQQVLREGAVGYLLNTVSIEELIQAIRAAHAGMPIMSPEVTQLLLRPTAAPTRLVHTLTDREQQVLKLMARGWNNQQIAAGLNITLSTVQFHTGNIFAKLRVRNRTEAAAVAFQHGFAVGDWAATEAVA